MLLKSACLLGLKPCKLEICCKQTSFLLLADYMLGLPFDPEDGGSRFLQNIGELQLDYSLMCFTVTAVVRTSTCHAFLAADYMASNNGLKDSTSGHGLYESSTPSFSWSNRKMTPLQRVNNYASAFCTSREYLPNTSKRSLCGRRENYLCSSQEAPS